VPPLQGVLRPAVAPWADPGGQPAARPAAALCWPARFVRPGRRARGPRL